MVQSESLPELVYPDSDGQPMADNTWQFNWIVKIKENLELMFAEDQNVFVAGDLLWYPSEGSLKRVAPDAMVVFGRPKGYRGSYKQWEENNIPPQVVFEILSPSNTRAGMAEKFQFYEDYGVEEYYIYDPERNQFQGYLRQGNRLQPIFILHQWVSPRLGIRFVLGGEELEIFQPNGVPFYTLTQLNTLAEQERQRAEQTEKLLEEERQRGDRLAEKLRELGLNPDQF
uniref:Putative restriction endonuclease domain-containing protein n=1 Tax=Cyanothece sp. (strain PCC 7425 / ATCC 29141) TaxID=395961 RepID=B8HYC8_CYAP4